MPDKPLEGNENRQKVYFICVNITLNYPRNPATLKVSFLKGPIAGALSNVEISDKLFVNPWTIDSYRKNIMTKLNVKSTTTLIKNGLL